jgi:Tfp pilus assembly protein PilF
MVVALSMIDQPGGAAKVSAMLKQARKKDPDATVLPEATVNLIGYEFLQAGDTRSALEVMQLNVEAYPDSPNVYDSLADAYVAAGQKDLALQNSKKALDLLASDTTDAQQRKDAIKASAEGKLKQLGASSQ